MKPIRDILKKAYERRLSIYDEIEQIDVALKEYGNALSVSGQHLLNNRTNISCKNGILTIFVPTKLFSPETHFVANELKELLQRTKNIKNIRAVRFQPTPN